MKGYIYKITLNNDKSYIGMKLSEVFNESYLGSSRNKAYWSDLEKHGIKEHFVLDYFEVDSRGKLQDIESNYIKENGLWPESYNYCYFNSKEGMVSSLEKYDTLSILNAKQIKKAYDTLYNEMNKKKISDKAKKYREMNLEKIKISDRERYIKNKEYKLEYAKIYREEHKKELKHYFQKYYLENKERNKKKKAERDKKYIRENKEKLLVKQQLYRKEQNLYCKEHFGKSFFTIQSYSKKEKLTYREYINKYINTNKTEVILCQKSY